MTSQGDVGRAPTRNDDVVDKARKRRDAADEESQHGTPVAGELGRVAVDAVKIVHVGNGNVAAADNIVAMRGGSRFSYVGSFREARDVV